CRERPQAVPMTSSSGRGKTFAPSLMTPSYHQNSWAVPSLVGAAFWVLIIALCGFFLALSAVQRNPVFLYFSGYFLSYAVMFYGFDSVFFVQGALSAGLMNALLVVPIIVGIVMSQKFLELNIGQDFANSLLFLNIIVIVSSFALSLLFGSSASGFDQYMIFLPAIVAYGLLCALSFIQAQQQRHGAVYLAAGWLAGLAGIFALFGVSIGLGNSAFMMSVYWAMILPQAVLFVMAALHHVKMVREEEFSSVARDNRAAQSLARIKQSRETADQARLLRVIERERELMADLREREIQRTQEMRKAKEAADEANRAKSAFLAVVSHEIRTPMNGIMGMLRLLTDTKLSKEQTEYTQAIQNSGDTMLALLNDILDFEKIESGNMTIEIIDFDMVKLIEGIVTLMSGHAAEKNIQLLSDIQPDFPTSLKGDPTRLRQVLLNLVSNAVKFTDEGSVTIELRAQPSEGQAGGSFEVTCAVRDTGIGISEDAQKNLFNPFTQAEESTSRKYGGTGLGLAICRNLIEAMGGAIQLSSQEGAGSRFFFTLNMEAGQKDFSENAFDIAYNEPSRPKIKPMKILVIDDNEMNRRVLDGFLQKDGHQTVLIGNAEEALKVCEGQHFDVIITDIRLHEMDGMDFTRALRASGDEKTAKTPVIALSGDVSAEDRERYTQAGMDGFLAKPIDPQALFEILMGLDESADAVANAPEGFVDDGTPFDDFDLDEDFDSFADAQEAHEQKQSVDVDPEMFDPTMLKSLVETLPKAQMDELLKSFLEKTDELVEVLSHAQEQSLSVEVLYDRAHELKGMAANFGLTGVGALAAKVESHAKDGELEKALDEIKVLEETNKKAQAIMQEWLAAQS
ncbi:MAG: ATP-binding protein, partial [Pseudomonadota bacterium]